MTKRLADDDTARLDPAHWQERLTALVAEHQVPGAALGILRVGSGTDDELVEVAAGVLNKDTGVETTPDSLFQIGSITKVWTTTLVAQLVDEGRLDLDAPVRDVLPGFRVSDPAATEQVTMRHLLTHTSGIDGDVFTDTGRGDDYLEKYVGLLADVAQNHPLGATWSYCNSGFNLAGRVIEELTGTGWDQALRDRIVEPLGLQHTVTLPEEALLHRAAVGHVSEDGEHEPTRTPVWMLPRSATPAGLITSTVADVLTFARMHLCGGVGRDGRRVLSEARAREMTEKHADVPSAHLAMDSWGLGWMRFGWDGHRLIGHDGSCTGQNAYLRILPDQGLAVALLTNGGHVADLYQDLYREIFDEVAGIEVPRPLGPPETAPQVDLRRHVGRYERQSVLQEVLVRDDRLVLRVTPTERPAGTDPEPPQEFTLLPADGSGDLFVLRAPGMLTWTTAAFLTVAETPYLLLGLRVTPRTGTG